MNMLKYAFLGVAAAALAGCSEEQAATGGLQGVANAMGATNLNTIQYEGSGSVLGFGQAYEPGERWPRFDQRLYRVQANYQAPGLRLEQIRAQGEHPPRGGAAQPVAGEQRTVLVVSGENAWAEGGNQANPQNNAAGDRTRMLWATPHGVIKAAMANNGTMDGNTIKFTAGGREYTAMVDAQNHIEKVSYQSYNSVVGDYPVEVTYSDYADFNGVMFPKHFVETQDGFPTLDINVTQVSANPTVDLTVPQNVASATPPAGPPNVEMEELGPGVWYVNAQGIRSWAVEFRDHIVAVEGPASEARSLAVNEAIKAKWPNKPIRYVINTHAHYDHAGGLRTYVAQGATVVTQEANKAFYEKTWARPHTIQQDLLAKEPKQPMFETVADKKVMTDGQQTLELYHVKGSGHHVGMIFVYSPRARAVYWGDGYNPPEGDDPRDPARTPEFGLDLYRNIVASGVNVQTIAPAHGAGARPFDNLRKAIGLMAVTQ
jgi:glyoxylase-like metal-dependent hydrolase (beta-lactamase superfamily II)